MSVNINDLSAGELYGRLEQLLADSPALADGVGVDELSYDEDEESLRIVFADAGGATQELQMLQFSDFQRQQLRMQQFELSHMQPQDNVYEWFRSAITEASAYPGRFADARPGELAEGWRTLQTDGPASPQLDAWFDRMTAGAEGPIETDSDPRVGVMAHRSTIMHLYRFEHEFGGHVDGSFSDNIAAAVESVRLEGYMQRVAHAARAAGQEGGHEALGDYDWAAAMHDDLAPDEAVEDAQFRLGRAALDGGSGEPIGGAAAETQLSGLLAATQAAPPRSAPSATNPYAVPAPAAVDTSRTADGPER